MEEEDNTNTQGQGQPKGTQEDGPAVRHLSALHICLSCCRQAGPGESSAQVPAGLAEEEASRNLSQLLPSGPGESSAVQPAAGMQGEASRDLARMIALGGYHPSVVEDDYFRSFLRRLNPGFQVPSREDIEKMCFDIFEGHRRDLSRLIDDDAGMASLAVGQSKTIEARQFFYVTAHFIDHHWNLHSLIDQVYLALADVYDHYHFPLRPVPELFPDDVVDYILSYLKYRNKFKDHPLCQVFMIAGEMTGHINHLKLMEEPELHEVNYITVYMDHVLDSIARCLLPDPDFADVMSAHLMDSLELGCLTNISLTKFGLLHDPWVYNEPWYSCYCSLEIFVQKFPDKYSEDSTELLLRTIWRDIYRAINRVSDSSRPTSNLCLQELFKVRDALQSQLLKAHVAVHTADYSDFGEKNVADVVRNALDTVDKAIQDSYLVWSIPLVLDPRYKLRYIKIIFERAFGSEAKKYVSKVRRKTKELYTSDTEDDSEDSDTSIEEMAVDSSNPLESETELDHYLKDSLARETENFDILNWWKVHGSVQYPTVARLARDAIF